MIHDCCVYVRNVFVCPLEVLMCFFHKTVKKTSIPAKGAVFVFHKIADTNDDFSFTKYLSEGMFSWSYTKT
jgi:hypothetical protein